MIVNNIRFWQTKIHEGDRRGTKSQIEIGSDGDSVKDHADVTKESSEDSASKVTKRTVMVMVMVMVMNMRMCRTGRQSTRRRMMCDHLEIGTISTGTGEGGTLANVTLSTRRLAMMVTRAGIAP